MEPHFVWPTLMDDEWIKVEGAIKVLILAVSLALVDQPFALMPYFPNQSTLVNSLVSESSSTTYY